jgi:transposase-like protein
MHAFTPQQRAKLLANRNVQDVTEKSVTFNPTFKIRAVHQYLNGFSPDVIFSEAGIPLDYFKDVYCRNCLKRWVQKYEVEGEDALKEDGRGSGSTGRPPKERLEDLTYDELLALVEIQQEALEEVKKQNALARKKKV